MTERECLQKLLYGQGAHALTLNSLEGLDEKLARERPANATHSIYQILAHMIYWQEYELQKIAGENPSYPAHAGESWLTEPAPKNLQALGETIQRFAEGLKRYEALLANPATDLERTIEVKKNETVRDVIVMIIAHNSHHLGQIITLRQQLGAWPPPKGGDTW